MKGLRILALVALTLPSVAFADVFSLQEILFNLNGTTYHNTYAVPGLSSAAFDDATGLGSLVLTLNPGYAGVFFFGVFFDHQLHAPFYNEHGAVTGVPGAGISWQIDEPGFGDGNRLGTIFDNTSGNALDNTNHVPGALSNSSNECGANNPGHPVDPACNNDVSMAMGFNMALAGDEFAVITLALLPTHPAAGFYLEQVDPDSPGSLFLTGAVTILPTGGPVVPEPGSWALLGTAALILVSIRRRTSRS